MDAGCKVSFGNVRVILRLFYLAELLKRGVWRQESVVDGLGVVLSGIHLGHTRDGGCEAPPRWHT